MFICDETLQCADRAVAASLGLVGPCDSTKLPRQRDAEEVEGVGNGEGYPLPSELWGWGECHELPHWGPGQRPGRNWIL